MIMKRYLFLSLVGLYVSMGGRIKDAASFKIHEKVVDEQTLYFADFFNSRGQEIVQNIILNRTDKIKLILAARATLDPRCVKKDLWCAKFCRLSYDKKLIEIYVAS